MNPAIFPLVGALLDKFIPDQAAAAEAKAELTRLAQAGDLAQIDVNKIEAAQPGMFKGGWRPATGWVCVAGLAIDAIVSPIAQWGAALAGHPLPPLPPLSDGQLLTLLLGLLGLGGLRTIERKAGRA